MTSTHILYVECEPALSATVKVFLEGDGAFDVTICKSGVEALKLLAVQYFDAIVSEFLMPEMCGIEFITCLRQNGDDTPFIFFTRTGGEDAVIEALNNGADFYIKKSDNPVSQFSLLKEKIEFLISRRQKKAVFSETGPGIIFNGNPVPLALVSVNDAVFVAVNDMFLQTSGYTREEVIGKSTKELGIFADETDIECLICELNKKQFVNGMEMQLRLKSGEIRICRFFSRILMLGEKYYTLSSIVDITEKKKTEKALKNEITMRRILIDQSRDGIVTLDNDGKVFETNQRFADMLGYTTEEVRNMSVLDWDKQIEPEILHEMIRTIDEEGDHFETVHTRKDGSEIKVEISTNAAYFSGKKLIFCVVRDITVRKRAEDVLRSVNRKLNLLTYITCHDILNKAIAIKIFLSLLDENDLKHEISACLGEANKAVESIERQIEFAREYEMVGLKEPVWLSIKKLTESLFDMRLEISVDSKGAFVYADVMLERVFYNLFDNTLRHAEGAVKVNILCRETSDSTLLITWEDNGPGIENSLKEEIFKRGYGKNRGFGLFLAREILKITGISIIETGVYGKGARFEISVPKGGYRFEKTP